MKKIFRFIFCTLIYAGSHGIVNAAGNDFDSQTDLQIIFIKDDDLAGNSLLYEDIISLGYKADVILPNSVTIEILNQYDLVVLSTGNYPFACQNTGMRLSLQTFIVDFSGKVIIEGGHTGYISAVFPFYLGFRTKVIKIEDWITDNGGTLSISPTHAFSDLALDPNTLPANLEINYSSIYDQDVCIQDVTSEMFYGSASNPDRVGILVAPRVTSPQVINYFVYYSAIANRTHARNLLQNSIFNLIGSPVSVNNNSELLASDFELFQNYPNPFNPVTTISYRLSHRGFVSVKIHDMLGNLILTLVDGTQSPGEHKLIWDASNNATGIYYYSFSIDGLLIDSKKMSLLK